MSGKVKKVTITGAALLAMGLTGPSAGVADTPDDDTDAVALQDAGAVAPIAAPDARTGPDTAGGPVRGRSARLS